ncbi:MAG: SDR family NAD(P)-dependent oxidoreductase [Chloroflexota bacterium]
MNLKDKTMLVTGASSGIGAATARLAARQGARVLLVARSAEKLAQLAAEIRADGALVHAFPTDLTDEQAVRYMAQKVCDVAGTPDLIFNNAGTGRWLYADETSMSDATHMMAAPYLAAFYVTRAFLPAMCRRNHGMIVNMTSVAAYMAWPGATAYTAARWAMRGFTEGLRADVAHTRLHVMLTVFAKVKSEYWIHNPGSEERVPGIQAMIPALSSEQAAQAILTGVRRQRRTVIAPAMLRVVLTLNAWFPSVTRWLLYNTSRRRAFEHGNAFPGENSA